MHQLEYIEINKTVFEKILPCNQRDDHFRDCDLLEHVRKDYYFIDNTWLLKIYNYLSNCEQFYIADFNQ